ncbi:hypothetical protein SOVF_146050, partial [Spinacia oleracea]
FSPPQKSPETLCPEFFPPLLLSRQFWRVPDWVSNRLWKNQGKPSQPKPNPPAKGKC